MRFLEFFAPAIRNPHTRRAYARAAGDFLAWCTQAGVTSIIAVQSLHVAAWIELQTQTLSASTTQSQTTCALPVAICSPPAGSPCGF
ncbi:site-specific integrase [Paraburkholderia diazotrophica]|uniref:Phage integrase, N-terminal SAM-like domain n=1 Tax=Paraburkholderia diazotrophica TaxID=667676 RepID=A0A1H7EQ85_9BURK|nr:hypothetical protein [Paraburkholderia diazotrophica]SEK13810.1 Phage integrase, N-terminal SAM-like domain [Paraburkholderia diazotrophica]